MNQDPAPRSPVISDGRHARGVRRRAEIIEAALLVVARDGASGVTHRTVAAEAGTRSSLIAYHFSTIDELLIAALTTVAEDYTARIQRIIAEVRPADRLRALAELLAESAGPGRMRAVAERELATLAARRAELAPLARCWREQVTELGTSLSGDPDAVLTLVAASEGLCTGILLGSIPSEVEQVERVLTHALGPATTPRPSP